MNYTHKKLLAFDYVNETFNTYGNQIQEVSFSPIVYSFFPKRSERAKLVEEMVNMITAQRAYEVNSKAIQSADEMLQNTNNLIR